MLRNEYVKDDMVGEARTQVRWRALYTHRRETLSKCLTQIFV